MNRRETESVEFKKTTSELKQGVISIASMLNKGGKAEVWFGVRNDGQIHGLQIGKDTTRDISMAIRNNIRPTVIPSVEILTEEGRQIIRVQAAGDKRPYSAYGRYYIRSDDEDLLMDNDTLYEIFQQDSPDYSRWERSPSGYSLEAVDEERLIEYFNQANNCGRINSIYRDPLDALKRLSLISDGQLNNAGYYLFSKDKPLKLKLAVYNTDERLSFSYIDLFEGNIFECIEAGIQFVSRYMTWSAEIVATKRVEVPEIPLEAVREIVVNSFAHMKYADSDSINNMIYFTPSELRIINAGGFFKGARPEDFAEGRMPPQLRNPLINMVLYKNRTIDSFASGFTRTFSLCRQRRIEYRYSDEGNAFSFSFVRKQGMAREAEPDPKESRRNAIVEQIRRNSAHTRESLAKKLSVSSATIARELSFLQKAGVLRHCGSNKSGYWEITEAAFRKL